MTIPARYIEAAVNDVDLPLAAYAEALGCSIANIVQRAERMGIEARRRRHARLLSEQAKAAARKLADAELARVGG